MICLGAGGGTAAALDGNVLTGTLDLFLTKYDSTGVRIWTKQMGVQGKSTGASALALTQDNFLFVAGGSGGGFDGNSLSGVNDAIVFKIDLSGNKQ